MKSPIALIVLDGWGLAPPGDTNAIHLAKTPVFDGLWRKWPHTELCAHGECVGLMPGQMGDSNVGHLNLGAGRIVYQDLTRICRAIQEGAFFENPVLLAAMAHAKEHDSALHLMGLLSDGGVHSHESHYSALVKMAAREGVTNLVFHCFLDGRDVGPKSALKYIENLETLLKNERVGRIATVMGRYYPMDRDGRWERVQKAYDAMMGVGTTTAPSAKEAVLTAYAQGVTDEFVSPVAILDKDGTLGRINPEDALIFFNFRADRARQITRAFLDPELSGFERDTDLFRLGFFSMTQHDARMRIPAAYPPVHLPNVLGEVVASYGLRQLRLAETEKYAHVTFFFNGMREEPFSKEERVLIPSPKVATYDLRPEMSALEVAHEAVLRLGSDAYDFFVLNFANADMVGHTGNTKACTKGVQTVDTALGMVLDALTRHNGVALIVADHGNAEQMRDADGEAHTAHTDNPVPCILVDPFRKSAKLNPGILANVGPTLLEIMGIKKPLEMDQESLIRKDGRSF